MHNYNTECCCDHQSSRVLAVVSRKCRRMEVAGSWWSRHALISSRTMRTSCLSTRASLSTSHARRKVDGGREALTAKPAGSLAITSERSSHVVSGQSKILSCIVRNIIKQVSPFLFSPEKPISPKAVKGLDVPQLTKNYYNVVSTFRRVNRFQKEFLTSYLNALFVSQVVQDILEHEREFIKELQTVLGCYLRTLQTSDK